jgi:hypothetical protein
MALSDSNGGLSPADISAILGNNGGNWGFGNDWWAILFLFAMMGGWGNGFGGFGGNQLGYDFPWLLNGQNGINANTNAGFDHASTQNAIGNLQTAVTSGFGDVQTSLCGGFAGVNATINGAQSAIAQQMYANQIADMERSFNAQTASTQGMNALQSQLAQCCCENRQATADVKYTIATEACADRATSTANTQAILDKLCQLELDTYKNQVEAKNETIAQLRSDLQFARGQASQDVQTAQILAGQTNEVDALYNRLKNCPVNAVPVYGSQPIFTCPNNGYGYGGCGCGLA